MIRRNSIILKVLWKSREVTKECGIETTRDYMTLDRGKAVKKVTVQQSQIVRRPSSVK